MKKANLIIAAFLITFFNITFSMGWLKSLLAEKPQNQSLSAKNNQERRKTIESIQSLKQSADDGDVDSINAYNKFEQVVRDCGKEVTELKLKRILDALDLIDSSGKVTDSARDAFKELKK